MSTHHTPVIPLVELALPDDTAVLFHHSPDGTPRIGWDRAKISRSDLVTALERLLGLDDNTLLHTVGRVTY